MIKKLLFILALSVSCYGQILAPIMQKAPSGAAPTPVRAVTTGTGTSTSWNAGTATVQTGDLCVGYGPTLGGLTSVGAGFTEATLAEPSLTILMYQNTSGTSCNPTATVGSGAWAGIAMGFKHTGTPAYVTPGGGQLNGPNPQPLTIAASGGTTAGNLMLACVNQFTSAGAPTLSVSDSKSNTWTAVNTIVNSGNWYAQCFWSMSASSGADTITYSSSNGTDNIRSSYAEFSGIVSN